jgi:hypothetical protein
MSFPVPDACTLPTVDQPLRLAEFDDLFATAVRQVERIDAHHVRLRLAGPVGLAASVRDLTARETQCCSFFAFTVAPEQATADTEALTMDIEVPSQYADVLDSLAQWVCTVASRRAS